MSPFGKSDMFIQFCKHSVTIKSDTTQVYILTVTMVPKQSAPPADDF